MQTKRLDTSPAAIALAATLIRRGELVAFPTETVYGLGGHALDEQAVQAIFTAKGRPASDPLIVHLADRRDLPHVAASIRHWRRNWRLPSGPARSRSLSRGIHRFRSRSLPGARQ